MSTVPNLPSLSANGDDSKAYNSSRTFSRPYSAKMVYFYKEGDEYFQGVRLPVSKARYRTLESLLDDLNSKVPLYFGVRRVFTPTGKREVHSIDEFQNLGRYVCASSKWTKGLTASERYQQWKSTPFENEKLFMQKRQRQNGPNLGNAAPAVAAAENTKEKISQRLLVNNRPRPLLNESGGGQQQVLVTLNGTPSRVYRMQFRTRRLPQFDDVLTELSEMFNVPITKIYTADGMKVTSSADILAFAHLQLIAYQRHERPTAASKLPPITLSTNGTSTKKSLPQRIRQVSPIKKQGRVIDPLPNIKTSDESNEKKSSVKKLRRRTISKRRKKVVGVVKNENEDETALHNAATKIQASFRGYRARKKLAERTNQDDDDNDVDEAHRAAALIQANVKGFLARKKYRLPKSQTAYVETEALQETSPDSIEDQREAKSHAAIAIQTSYRGYAARKRLHNRKNLNDSTVDNDKEKTESKDEKPATASMKKEKLKKAKKIETTKKKIKKPSGEFTYRISIYVGNRWAADSDADLYLILHGQKSDSKKLMLRQSQKELRFQQNQMDSFDVEAPYVGLIQKVTVGHDSKGYGAGVFIDRVVVTETQIDSLQYFFPCSKWLDSGQVDGKIERVCQCAGYQKLGEKTADAVLEGDSLQLPTKGRWTIRLHVENAVPENFTVQLFLTAYGTFGRSEMIPFANDLVVKNGAEYSLDVGLGDLGELFKIRVDSQQAPGTAWLLDWIEMKDVDTGEEMRLLPNKWFCDQAPQNAKVSNPQTFRDVSILKMGMEPLPTYQYNVNLQMSDNRNGSLTPVAIQLTGEFGDSGSYVLSQQQGKKGKEVAITIESVSLGRLMFVSVSAPLTDKGASFAEGFRALQEIYDRHGVPASVASQWIVQKAVVRESLHAPYQFIFADSRIVEPDSAGSLRKQLILTDMEGLTTITKPLKTKLGKEKNPTKTGKTAKSTSSSGQWRVFVVTGDHADGGTDCTPYLIVYGDDGLSKPTPLLDKKQRFTPGSICQFDVDLKNIGRIFKVRVRLDTSGPNPMWYLKRMKMKDLSTGDELRFPVEMWLEKNDDNPEVSVELPAVWPDVPPLPSVLYNITLCTGTNSDNDTDFDVYLIVFGQKGDTGKRFLRSPVGTQESSSLKPGNVDTFELEAVSVRDISKIQIGLEPRKASASWLLERVEILDPESERLYLFPCNKWFSDSKADQKLERVLIPVIDNDNDKE